MTILKNNFIFSAIIVLIMLSASSCMDEVSPVNYVSAEQVSQMTSAQESLLNGIISFTNDYNTWGDTGDEAYYLNDWGYPCQMYFRDVLTADFPTASSSYNYWINSEQGVSLRYTPYYTYNYYYKFIKSCNNLISVIDTTTATTTSLNYLGCALVLRALCYLDMARLFEYQPTGYASLDSKAENNGVIGLTIPLVTEKTTEDEARNNPRLPFYTMYRFILTDLNNAVKYLEGYQRPNGTYPNQSVAYGMLARLWLEIATRFEKTPVDLTTQLSHESDNDGYNSLGITTATECYKKAADYAHLATEGYTPMTQDEWTAPSTGFNTATNAWMLFSRISTKEQQSLYYSSFLGTICTEAKWGMPQYGPYREICSYLFKKMPSADWRKLSWIAPKDAGKTPAEKYQVAQWSTTDATTGEVTTSDEQFKKYPAYANLKFRTRNNIDQVEGMMCDIPMMRVEEMYFIEAEATAHVDGVAAGIAKLNEFMNTYRYTNGSYSCTASSIEDFTEELIIQKRIELWGEGLSLFDYKRLKMPVLRSQSSNYLDAYLHDSKQGYVCPSMNYYILDYAKDQNAALQMNPDCSEWYNLD